MKVSVQIKHNELVQEYFFLQDDQIPASSEYHRPGAEELGSLPGVMRFEPYDNIPLTSERQWFWFNQNRSALFSDDYRAFVAYTEDSWAVCNGQGIYDQDNGTQMGRDYIKGVGLQLGLAQMFTVGFVRHTGRGKEVKLTERQGYLKAGTWALALEYIDVNKPLPNISKDSHPWLFPVANIIKTKSEKINGLLPVNAVPQGGGRYGKGIVVPLWGRKQLYYSMDRLQKLPLGAPLPSPYNPS